MGIREIIRLIPAQRRRAGVAVSVTVLVRSLLDFVGVAAMVPVLVVAIDPGAVQGNALLGRWMEITGPDWFAASVCGAALIVVLLKNLLAIWLGMFQTKYVTSLYRHFSAALFENYYRRGLLFVKSSNSTDLAHKINGVCSAFAQGCLSPLFTAGGQAVLMLLIWGALVAYAPVPALVVGAGLAMVGWGYSLTVRRRMGLYGKQENEARRRQWRIVTDVFRGYAEAEVNGAYPLLKGRFDKGLEEVSHCRERTDAVLRVPAGLTEVCAMAALAAVVLLYKGDGGQAGLALGVFAVAAMRMLPAARMLINTQAQIRSNEHAAQIIAEALAEGDVQPEVAQAAPLTFNEAICLEHVTFRFPDSDEAVIADLSLEIRKGERLGIRGASGAGKTTLLNLLLGFYSPEKGAVTVDGRALDASTRTSWHALTGYVPQEVFIMDDTLAANVAFGAGEPDYARVLDALSRARLGELAASLPEGVDTRIGEAGSRLSGGQRQRVGIARALYKGAQVLFFDEATSSLDPQTEGQITEAIRTLPGGEELTMVVISHRPSSLSFCDRIIDL